jgi:hypothetical protein
MQTPAVFPNTNTEGKEGQVQWIFQNTRTGQNVRGVWLPNTFVKRKNTSRKNRNKQNVQTRKKNVIMDCDEKAKQIQKRREHRQLQQYYLEKGLKIPLQSSLNANTNNSNVRPIHPLMGNARWME